MNEQPQKSLQLHGSVIRAARIALHSVVSKPLMTWLAVGGVTGFFLALVGALGSYEYALSFRLVFWLLLCLTGAAIAAAIEFLLGKLSWGKQAGYLKWLALVCLIATVMTPVAYLANSTGGLKPWRDLFMYFQNSLVISSAFVGVRLLLREIASLKSSPAENGEVVAATTAFMQRLPPKLRNGELRALCAEGHYIRVWTDLGSDLVLFRLKDAVRELSGLQGMQVHRSWWVARGAIRESRRENGRLWLLLEGDIRAPVSRPNIKKLKESGWL